MPSFLCIGARSFNHKFLLPSTLLHGHQFSVSVKISPSLSISSITSAEGKYALLSTFDAVFVIDDSGSMAGQSWREVREALSTVAPVCTSHDPDGIDVYVLNHQSSAAGAEIQAPGGYFQIRNTNQVQHLLESVRPCGSTLTGTRLIIILTPYVSHISRRASNLDSTKLVNIIVTTDGRLGSSHAIEALSADGLIFSSPGNKICDQRHRKSFSALLSLTKPTSHLRSPVEPVYWLIGLSKRPSSILMRRD
jgi:hypothetical protein